MYSCGDLVVYGMHGVCKIAGIEERTVDRKAITYYALAPVGQAGAQFYIPVHNETAVAKMRPLLNRESLENLLRSNAILEDVWIPDEGKRKQYYKEVICSGDREALLRMVRTLHLQRRTQLAMSRKFHLCDENFLRDAERLLYSEFSIVLDIPVKEVASYILEKIED